MKTPDFTAPATYESLQERAASLPERQQHSLRGIIDVVLQTMEAKEGCVVLMADADGGGQAALLIIGNALLAGSLTRCAADAMKEFDVPVGEKH